MYLNLDEIEIHSFVLFFFFLKLTHVLRIFFHDVSIIKRIRKVEYLSILLFFSIGISNLEKMKSNSL